MRKLIHSSFELDLSKYKISDTEENNWFSDSFFAKYTFPFEIDLVDDLDVAFGFISQYNTNPQTYYECKYVHNNKIEDAIFEIESHQDKLSCTVNFGFEQLPSFDKKLSELSLDKFMLPTGTTIYQHANTVITQAFPEVNYNFPQIHIDKYDTTDDLWFHFEGIINNRVDGNFITNTMDVPNDVSYNRNLMQPLPYWIHILQRGMIDTGYTLAGKIMNDQRLKKACLFGDIDYFNNAILQEPVVISLIGYDAVNFSSTANIVNYYHVSRLNNKGRFNIRGTFTMQGVTPDAQSEAIIRYRDTILYQKIETGNYITSIKTFYIEFNFDTVYDLNPDDIIIELKNQSNYPENRGSDKIVLTITHLHFLDENYLPASTIRNEPIIDLTRAVPDITFGDFIKVVKNWFNYDLTIIGKLAIMNPIEDEINFTDTLDLQFSEIKRPLRKFNQGKSFLLQFQEVDNKDFTFLPVFHSQSGITNSGFVADDKTTTIEINGLPLPLLTRDGKQTAYALEQNDSKAYLVCYDGLYNGNNLARPNNDYLIPAVHLAYWKKWFDFRINSHGFAWAFKAWNETIMNLKVKTKIFAYKRVHIIKTINKTEIKPDLFEVDIDCEALE